MRKHYTPDQIAQILAQWVPADAQHILEPAVGNGALLLPLLDRDCSKLKSIVCVDTDATALTTTKSLLRPRLGKALKLNNSDFLELNFRRAKLVPAEGFDCVILNPPFAGRVWAPSVFLGPSRASLNDLAMQIETAFLYKSISLLRPGGRLLAVIPASIATSDSGEGIRRFMIASGSIDVIYELPEHCFPGVEARVHLLVFTKGTSDNYCIRLVRWDASELDSVTLDAQALASSSRFDFSFHQAMRLYEQLQSRQELGWMALSEVATVKRGKRKSPEGHKDAIHTTDYRLGFWYSSRVKKQSGDDVAHKTDIIVARVGRSCLTSFGLLNGEPASLTDCLLRIRPKNPEQLIPILYSLRSLLQVNHFPSLLRRGGGAQYITSKDLASLAIPMKLATEYSSDFRDYRCFVEQRSFSSMVECESKVAARMQNEQANSDQVIVHSGRHVLGGQFAGAMR